MKYDEVRKGATSGKVVQTSGALYFSVNEKYEQSAVPEEIRRADKRKREREFSIREGRIAREMCSESGKKTAVQMRRKFTRRVFRLTLRRRSFLPLRLSLSLFLSFLSHLAFRHELSAPKSSATCTKTRKTRSRTSQARFRSRVTNHLSWRARFRSTPKRGERWNCKNSKNASRCDVQGIMQLRSNFCRLICSLTRKLFLRTFFT